MANSGYQSLVQFRRDFELPEYWEPNLLRIVATLEHMIRELSLDDDQEKLFLSTLFGTAGPRCLPLSSLDKEF